MKTQKLFRVKLNKNNNAQADQQKDGYLALFGKIQKYTRGQAIKKAKLFGGKIEEVKPIFKEYVCKTCGSTELVWDAWAAWDVESQKFVLESNLDYCDCQNCEGETTAVEKIINQ